MEHHTSTDRHDDWSQVVDSLYRAEFGRLVGAARRFLGPSGAEDVVQAVFERFATVANQPAVGSEAAYLRSMVMNEARSVLRRRQVHDRHLHRWLRPNGDSLDDVVVRLDEQLQLHRWLGDLSTRQRQVIELRYLHQYSEREIADRLNISAGSVKTHSCRGIAALRLISDAGAA